MKKEIPLSVKKLIEKVENSNSLNNQSLIKTVKDLDILEKDLLQYSTFNHCIAESYGRETIYKGENFGIYLMSWSQGDFTAIHNHGHSEWGLVYFFGNAEHRIYTAKGNKIKLEKKEILSKGTIAPVCGNLIHAMGNLSEIPFVTLHIYGSNSYKGSVTEDSKMYEIEKNRIRTTVGPAYINIKNELCKKDEYGIETCKETENDYYKLISHFYKRNNLELK